MTSTLPSPTTRYALALAVALGTVLFLLLGIGALGIVGDGDRDWLYLAAPAVLLVVAAATRFRPDGMVLALGAAAATTVVARVGRSDELLHGVDGVRQRQHVADRLEHGGHRLARHEQPAEQDLRQHEGG